MTEEMSFQVLLEKIKYKSLFTEKINVQNLMALMKQGSTIPWNIIKIPCDIYQNNR